MDDGYHERLEPRERVRFDAHGYHFTPHTHLFEGDAWITSMSGNVLIDFDAVEEVHDKDENGEWTSEFVSRGTVRAILDEETMYLLMSQYARRHPRGIEILGKAIEFGSRERREALEQATVQATDLVYKTYEVFSSTGWSVEVGEVLNVAHRLKLDVGSIAEGATEQLAVPFG